MRRPGDLAGAKVLKLDVTDQASVQVAVETVLDREGRIDAVVNNAGVGAFVPFEHSSDDDWLETFDTNLFGPVRVARAALPTMRAQGDGVIVNISSVAERVPAIPMQSAYSASKHGLCVLTDALNTECRAFGVRAVCIEPGFTATSIMEKHRISRLEDDDPYKPVLDNIEQFFRAGPRGRRSGQRRRSDDRGGDRRHPHRRHALPRERARAHANRRRRTGR